MPVLYVHCPNTEKPISTGLEFPEDYKARGIQMDHRLLRCPQCGKIHSWNPTEGHFESDEAAKEPAAAIRT